MSFLNSTARGRGHLTPRSSERINITLTEPNGYVITKLRNLKTLQIAVVSAMF